MKVCSKCKIEKDINEFNINKKSKDGLQYWCMQCYKKYRQDNKEKLTANNKLYYQENKEEFLINQKLYYQENKEKATCFNKQYYKDNKEELLIKNKQYYENNKEKILIQKRGYRQENKEELADKKKVYVKEKRKNNIYFKLRIMISSIICKALKSQNASKNGKSCLKYINYTIAELKIHLESLFEPWMTWENYGMYNQETWDDNDKSTWKWNIDHLIPQSQLIYRSMDDENFKKCWALSNLRPYSAKQNVIDGNRR